VTDAESAEFHRQVSDWDIVELDGIKRLRRKPPDPMRPTLRLAGSSGPDHVERRDRLGGLIHEIRLRSVKPDSRTPHASPSPLNGFEGLRLLTCVIYPSKRRSTRQALCPPKPNELETAIRMSASRASFAM
jgi:hypothetical protein